jgi:hypothetical protein
MLKSNYFLVAFFSNTIIVIYLVIKYQIMKRLIIETVERLLTILLCAYKYIPII